MAGATGPGVSVLAIRRALSRLQQAYRDRGYARAAVLLPRQPLTDGVVRLRVVEGPSDDDNARDEATPETATSPAWTAPAFEVRHFEVRGNTLLSPEEIDAILGPVAGPNASMAELEAALRRLREAYRQQGASRASVHLREQLLTDGTVAIWIDEGLAPEPAPDQTRLAVVLEPPAPAQPTFEVRRYEVLGNTLLRPEIVERAFTDAIGPAVTLGQIQAALGELQLAYRERGYATVSVGLPQQQLTDAVVMVQVTEGVLADIRVLGNRHFSSNNIARALPSLRTNTLLNSQVFQRELDGANQNRDRQIYPTIGPGPEPGTSALTLRVKDRLPLHGRLDLNNYSTPATPDWRVNGSASFNNLWQREHQVGFSYGFTPEAYKDGADLFLDLPLIANYGAYYRLPFGTPESVEQRITASPAFGYDEATRQFRLPPVGARPDLTIFASSSSSDTGIQYGPAVLVSQTPLLTIVSQDSGQNLSENDGVGARVSLPKTLDERRRLGFSLGPDWKRYRLESFNTNNFIITTVVTNSEGSQTIETRVSSPQPTRRNEVQYLPVSFGADFFQSDRRGTLAAGLALSGNVLGDDDDLAVLAHSTAAAATYGKATLVLTRDHRVFKTWSLLLRASGQVASGSLLSNEQFALGGMNSVRGYYEGDQYGDAGWFGSAELRTPFLNVQAPGWAGTWPAWLRGSVFLDYGQGFLLSAAPGVKDTSELWGAGVGISANINNRVDLRIALGWPFITTINTPANAPRAHVSLGGQF